MKAGRVLPATFLACTALVALVAAASGAIPEKINYQMMLTDDADQPLVNQTVDVDFRIYPAPDGGGSLWSESHTLTTNSIGVVTAVLGSTNPLAIDFDVPLWLEVEVEEEILEPRRELVAAPYALHARAAEYALSTAPVDSCAYADTAGYALATAPVDSCAYADTAAYALSAGSSATATTAETAANSDSLGGVAATDYALAADYVLATTLGDSGTINEGANPVAWTKLKGVPAGFADGIDDGGAADGHSLDADDGAPIDAVYVDSLGNVGVGTTAPAQHVTLYGDDAQYIQLTNAATGTTASDGLRVGIDGTGEAYVLQSGTSPINFHSDGGFGASLLGGSLELGDDSNDGRLQVHMDGGTGAIVDVYNMSDEGGALNLLDETGTSHARIEPDPDGGAGYLYIEGPGSGQALMVDGNDDADGSPLLAAAGAASAFEFDLSDTGDAAVVLPNNAIGSAEIVDEPGVACVYEEPSGGIVGPSYENIAAHTITVPAPGYVFVMACAQANCTHDTTDVSRLIYGVTDDSTTIHDGLDDEIQLEEPVPEAEYVFGVASAAVFPVDSAGTHEFYLVARADGIWYMYDSSLSLLYFPTAYGSVTGEVKSVEPAGEDDAPASAVRPRGSSNADSETWNDARIERELAKMEAEIAEIRAKIERGNRR